VTSVLAGESSSLDFVATLFATADVVCVAAEDESDWIGNEIAAATGFNCRAASSTASTFSAIDGEFSPMAFLVLGDSLLSGGALAIVSDKSASACCALGTGVANLA
jgi:hypothetical protein